MISITPRIVLLDFGLIVTVKLCSLNWLEIQNLLHLYFSSGKLVEPKQRAAFCPSENGFVVLAFKAWLNM